MTQSTPPRPGQPVIWVLDNRQLAEHCQTWLSTPCLACDTEFERTNTFYPIAALLQINDGSANYLIDPLRIDDWRPLAAVMQSPACLKVFHACGEDLDVLQRLIGTPPFPIVDTQDAIALLGASQSLGYGNAVAAYLGIQLSKDETRSNWLQRPLTAAQEAYAIADVEYLYALAYRLDQALGQCGRREAWHEEGVSRLENHQQQQAVDQGFYKSQNTWRQKPLALARAKRLFVWRETYARTHNIPRSRLFKDAALFELAERPLTTLPAFLTLARQSGLGDGLLRKQGETLFQLLADAEQDPVPDGADKPLSPRERERLGPMKAYVTQLAESANINPDLLVRKLDYHQLIRSQSPAIYPSFQNPADLHQALSQQLSGWRAAFFQHTQPISMPTATTETPPQ
jgi:ribonuclease D